MRWTVSRRVAAGFSVGLLAAVAVGALVAVRNVARAYDVALELEQRQVLPALRAESEFRRATTAFLAFLLERTDESVRERDSVLALARSHVEQLRESAPSPRIGWRGATCSRR